MAIAVLSTVLLVSGFFLPWLIWESPPLLPALTQLPESRPVEGWRVPEFARSIGRSWLVFLTGMFSEKEPPDPALAWLVYLSPLLGLLLPFALRASRWAMRVVGGLHLTVLAVVIPRLAAGERWFEALGFGVEPARGLWVAAIGHLTAVLLVFVVDNLHDNVRHRVD